jgi:transcriptional regulator with PAS, ATPase and Fis domain
MNKAFKHLIDFKQLGIIRFDSIFTIIEANRDAEMLLKKISISPDAKDLLEHFPEFIGNEASLKKILDRKTHNFRMEYVNRIDSDNRLCYLNLLVLPDEEKGKAILVIDDVTASAKMQQEFNQQKYLLLLRESGTSHVDRRIDESLLGKSSAIINVREMIQKIAKVSATTVLLLGESGTGKNLAARIIHYTSGPTAAPFVDINCAALPETLIESELFGYEKGAFTHATSSKPGLLEEAQGGTVFLDEIGDLPLNLQSKLLSVLETKKFRRLGSTTTTEVKARIVCATNRNLEALVSEKRFREDLYYRLNVVAMTLPPLRGLGEDVLIIADAIINHYNREFKKNVAGLTTPAKKKLLEYTWPGNVRELKNCLERAMIFIDDVWIDHADLFIGPDRQQPQDREWTVPPTGIMLEDVERQLIVSALDQTNGNKAKAARLLGLTRDTLRYRLEKYSLRSS